MEGVLDERIRKEESEAGKKNKEAVGRTQLSFSELVKNLSPETKPDQKLFIIPRREKQNEASGEKMRELGTTMPHHPLF